MQEKALQDILANGDYFERTYAKQIHPYWPEYCVVWSKYIGNKNAHTADLPHHWELQSDTGSTNDIASKWGYICRLHYSCFRKLRRAHMLLTTMKELTPGSEEYMSQITDSLMEILSSLQAVKEYYKKLLSSIEELSGEQKEISEIYGKNLFGKVINKRQNFDHWGGIPPMKIDTKTHELLIRKRNTDQKNESNWDEELDVGGYNTTAVKYAENIFEKFTRHLQRHHEIAHTRIEATFQKLGVSPNKTDSKTPFTDLLEVQPQESTTASGTG